MLKLFKKMPGWLRKTFAVFLFALKIIPVVALIAGIVFVVSMVNDHNAKQEESSNAFSAIMAQKESIRNETSLRSPVTSEQEFAQEPLDSTYRVDFIDVGHGDCTVLTNGKDTMIIDAGDMAGGKVVAKYLRSYGITNISMLVATNENPEHIGGLSVLMESFDVETLVVPNLNSKNEAMKACFEVAKDNNVEITSAKALDAWNVGQAQIQVLSSTQNLIIRISIQDVSFLLMSDASLEEELALLKMEMDISATFLKASAHGAAKTSDKAFVKVIAPEYAVVSCDEDVLKPNIKSLNRLYDNTIVYRTDRYGTITVLTDGCDYSLTASNV